MTNLSSALTEQALAEAIRTRPHRAAKPFVNTPGPRHCVPIDAADGVKFDSDKARMDLVPPEFVFATAEVLKFGAGKYGDRNWEKGMSWGRVFAAIMRHLWSWWAGGVKDPESGMSHLWHAACCLAFLIAYEARGIGTDDRHKPKDTK